MPEPSKKRPATAVKTATPEDYPVQSPQPSGDYTYTVEIVMKMQETMGGLKEAVEGLKADSRAHGDELKNMSKELHGYKMVGRVIAGAAVGAVGLFGWVIKLWVDYHKH